MATTSARYIAAAHLRSFAVALLVVATPARGGAAEPVPCAAELGQISALRQSIEACDASQRDLRAREQACRQQLGAESERLGGCRTTVKSLEASRDTLCRAVGDFARSLAEGETPTANLGACLPAQRQEQIAAELAAWRHVLPELRGLLQFATGERRALPRLEAPAQLPVEHVVAALIASDRTRPPILYRRLLVSALQRIAPRFWERLRAGGSTVVESWFGARSKLEEGLVLEARSRADVPQGEPGSAGAPLAAALKFVQTYLDLAACAELSPHARDCGRARQLQELLESSGPLVIERRTESIWASDCRALGPATVLEWLQDFPSSQARVDDAQWGQITEAGFTKLYTCFLADHEAGASFTAWGSRKLPGPHVLTGRALARLTRMRQRWRDDSDEELCGRAVRAIQRTRQPASCELPDPTREALAAWLSRESSAGRAPLTPALRACSGLLKALWQGKPAGIPGSFARPPSAAEIVAIDDRFAVSPMARLRVLCDERQGGDAFPDAVSAIAELAPPLGESPDGPPWRVDRSTGLPIELVRYQAAARPARWARNLLAQQTACAALGLAPGRCEVCSGARHPLAFDCELLGRLEQRWGRWRRTLWTSIAAVLGVGLLLLWAGGMWRAWRRFGHWSRHLRNHLESIGLTTASDRWRWLVPARLQYVAIDLPSDSAWSRWGRRAIVYRTSSGGRVLERDVNRAATRARSVQAEFTILAHDDEASPDLAAVRALLEWAGRGSTRSVQVLPVPVTRLHWLRNAEDLLDAIEQTSVRGNPFEMRGRITSASQFFDRERLVSGLLANVQAGNWVLVSGLRRFGKSSLALEVARRLPGPSAYVDLAGFHHEIATLGDAAGAANTILQYTSLRLHESAVARYGSDAAIPPPLRADRAVDGAEMAEWYRSFASGCAQREGHRAASMLIIFDELEQAIRVDPERLPRALDVLSILIGRLRAALGDPIAGGTRTGLLLCGAMHPVLWAPLPTLAGQSLMGALQSVFVPRLPDDAAYAMMRALGVRQGIRFTDPALKLIVEEGHGIALLVRRLASSVLELYDPERARQGSLGAVEIGIEGASAAVRREEEEGAPLRVWVESEIGDPQSPAGALLRRVASAGRLSTAALRAEAIEQLGRHFAATGIDRLLPPDERVRRVAEAAAVMVRMLGETGLLVPEGDLTSPDAYAFSEGIVRRILGRRRQDAGMSG